MAVRTPQQRKRRSQKRRGKRPGGGFGFIRRVSKESWRASCYLFKTLRTSPLMVRILVVPVLSLLFILSGNWAYQTFQKPTEVFFPFDQFLAKRPGETWRQYQSLFRQHATPTITPEFLAALAQVEASGNPVARTYWRWRWSWNPLDWYQPASTAVGMYQMTDGTFQEASRLCIHDHRIVEDGPWHDWRSCWFNAFYTRILPSHAIELTAAWLDRGISQTLKSQGLNSATLRQKHNLGGVIHLCGFRIGQTYAARQFRLQLNQQCGDHIVKDYLARLNALKFGFQKPAAGDKTINKAT